MNGAVAVSPLALCLSVPILARRILHVEETSAPQRAWQLTQAAIFLLAPDPMASKLTCSLADLRPGCERMRRCSPGDATRGPGVSV